jgi:hypothetical protein
MQFESQQPDLENIRIPILLVDLSEPSCRYEAQPEYS